MKRIGFLAVGLCAMSLCSTAFCKDLTSAEVRDKYVAASMNIRSVEVARIDGELSLLKKNKSMPEKKKKDQIQLLEMNRARWLDWNLPVHPKMSRVELNAIGTLPGKIEVFQVVDEKTAIADVVVEYLVNEGTGRTGAWESRTGALPPTRTVTKTFAVSVWLAEFNTEGWVDGQRVSDQRPMVVFGTHSYETEVGKRTVLKVRPIRADEMKPEPEKPKAVPAPASPAGAPPKE